MPSVVEFRLPVDEFAFSETVTILSECHVAIERFVAQGPDLAVIFMWVSMDNFDAFEAAVAEDSSVNEFSTLAEIDRERFYRMQWVTDIKDVLQCFREVDGTIATATLSASSTSWKVQLICPERNAISEIYECCMEKELSVTVDALYEVSDDEVPQHELTNFRVAQ